MGNEASKEAEQAEAQRAKDAQAQNEEEGFDLDKIPDHDESPPPEQVPIVAPKPPPVPTSVRNSKGQFEKQAASTKKRRKGRKVVQHVPEQSPEPEPEPGLPVQWQPSAEEQRRVREESPEMHDEYAMSASSVLGEDAHNAMDQGDSEEDEETNPPASHTAVDMSFPIPGLHSDKGEHPAVIKSDDAYESPTVNQYDSEGTSGKNLLVEAAGNESSVFGILNEDTDEIGREDNDKNHEIMDDSDQEGQVDDLANSATAIPGKEDITNIDEQASDDAAATAEAAEISGETDAISDGSHAEMTDESIQSEEEPVHDSNISETEQGIQGQQSKAGRSPTEPDSDIEEHFETSEAAALGSRVTETFVCVEVPKTGEAPTGHREELEQQDVTDDTGSGSQKKTVNKPYRCQHCATRFNVKHKLDRHMLAHCPPQFVCPFCDDDQESAFARKDKATEHIKRRHSKAELAEAKLMSLWVNEAVNSATMHVAQEQLEYNGDWPCPQAEVYYCTLTFTSRKTAKKHAHAHDNTGRFVCPVCKHGAVRKSNLKQHQRKYHSEDSVAHAKELFKQREDDTRRSHSDDLTISCPYTQVFSCEEVFDDDEAAERHCSMAHERDHHCPVCEHIFLDGKALYSHKLRIHPQWELLNARKEIAASIFGHDEDTDGEVDLVSDSDSGLRALKSTTTQPQQPESNRERKTADDTMTKIKDRQKTLQPQNQRAEDGKEEIPCPYAEDYNCTKTFKWKKTAIRHGKTHEVEWPCICDKVYRRKDLLMDHFNSMHPQSERHRLQSRRKAPAPNRPEIDEDASVGKPIRHSQRSTKRVRYSLAENGDDANTPDTDDEDAQNNIGDNEVDESQQPTRKRKRTSSGSLSSSRRSDEPNSRKRTRYGAGAQQKFSLDIPSDRLIDRSSSGIVSPVVGLGVDDVDSGFASAEEAALITKVSKHRRLHSTATNAENDSDAYEDSSNSNEVNLAERSPANTSQTMERPASARVRHTTPDGSELDEVDSALGSDMEDPKRYCRTCHKSFKSGRAKQAHDKDKKAHLNLEECSVCDRLYHSLSALRQHKIDASHDHERGQKPKHSGHFTMREEKKIKAWRQQICREHDLSKVQFNDMMSTTRDPRNSAWTYKFMSRRDLLTSFYEVLPKRDSRSLRLYRDIHLHNGEKGADWATEDDRDLLRHHKELGPKWVEIGARLSRTSVDVKRRYQNKLQHGDKLEHGEWSNEESIRFDEALEEVRDVIQRPPGDNFNWQAVSQKVGTRTPIQCANHWRALHGFLVGNRWRKPKDQRSAQRGRSKMENRLLGVQTSSARPSRESAEFIVDSDEEAGLSTTPSKAVPALGPGQSDGVEEESDSNEKGDRADSKQATDSEGTEEGTARDEESEADSGAQYYLHSKTLPTRTPQKTMSLSQAFHETQAHTSAVQAKARTPGRSSPQDRPSPDVAVRYRPERLSLDLLDNDDLQSIAEDVKMVDASEANTSIDSDSSEPGDESDASGDNTSIAESDSAVPTSAVSSDDTSSESDEESTVSDGGARASSRAQVNRNPHSNTSSPRSSTHSPSLPDEDGTTRKVKQTPWQRLAALKGRPSPTFSQLGASSKSPEIEESSSASEPDSSSSSESEVEQQRAPRVTQSPNWARTPLKKREVLSDITTDFISSVQTTAKNSQRRTEMYKRSQRRDDSEEESD